MGSTPASHLCVLEHGHPVLATLNRVKSQHVQAVRSGNGQSKLSVLVILLLCQLDLTIHTKPELPNQFSLHIAPIYPLQEH